ncbi:CRP/FNR family transcriptional regulator, anaerobic regulatory protein [Marinobacter sp. es.042]|uniref:Crp/Fnr family transcriptional regulator n=1 Tax=Marinobacter sp. es.042 TaxID=1761794 RepID=UPI000B5126A0|nr:Crp/Fnr family transcriptional regulator [Marinobacter sp. es.042]SNB56757.1 CRP/FNR family transcriptional regulator, anaerobic regulatory protein [Marinobacter sp. es.042]
MVHHSILDTLPEDLRRDALNSLQTLRFEHGKILFRAGDPCQGLPLVLNGSVKVQMTGLSGNRIVLYRMGADDICTLSIGCLMTGDGFRAEAVVEDDAEVFMVPRGLFDRLMDQSADFRLGIMESYGRRLNDLMLLVEEVAFRRMDERLVHWLEARAGQGAITITHQELAVELGTAREVVSRLLKELERKGRLRLARGKIDFTGAFAE